MTSFSGKVASLIQRRRRKLAEDVGVVALLVAVILTPTLLAAAAIGVDISNWYMTAAKLQRTADAAALAGVTYMPGSPAVADSTAKCTVNRNGFVVAGADAGCLTTTGANNRVPVTALTGAGIKRSQLRVTLTTTVKNFFGGVIGSPSQTLTRTSVADYQGPISMGSPCNTFGNEPVAGDGTGSVSSGCTSTPQFWANAAGPGSKKGNGDAFETRSCVSGNSGCSGTTNTDFDPRGQFYKVSVGAGSGPVNFQLFDPTMAEVGDTCTSNLPASWTKDKPNTYSSKPGDAAARYKSGSSSFCTGDHEFAANGTSAVTTFAVRSPSNSADPMSAPIVPGCTQQFKGWGGTVDFAKMLDNTNAAYNDDLAKSFRQWVSLCTISSPTVGDYYIQVRTNVPYNPGSAELNMNSPSDFPSVTWAGHNRFSMRVKAGSDPTKVAVAGAGRMVIYANASGANTEFHLARIGSAAAGKNLTINLFDTGDASKAGTLTILPPAGSPALSECAGLGAVSGSPGSPSTLSGCQLTNVSNATYEGKTQVLVVRIPTTYTCDDRDPNACWFKIQFNFPSGTTVNDTTSWWSALDGDPVRIVE